MQARPAFLASIHVTSRPFSNDVLQDEVLVSPGRSARFFDSAWTDRPGGWFAGLGATVAKVVAQQHGGDAVLLAGERRGSTLKITFK